MFLIGSVPFVVSAVPCAHVVSVCLEVEVPWEEDPCGCPEIGSGECGAAVRVEPLVLVKMFPKMEHHAYVAGSWVKMMERTCLYATTVGI